jgi:hypothetical protein
MPTKLQSIIKAMVAEKGVVTTSKKVGITSVTLQAFLHGSEVYAKSLAKLQKAAGVEVTAVPARDRQKELAAAKAEKRAIKRAAREEKLAAKRAAKAAKAAAKATKRAKDTASAASSARTAAKPKKAKKTKVVKAKAVKAKKVAKTKKVVKKVAPKKAAPKKKAAKKAAKTKPIKKSKPSGKKKNHTAVTNGIGEPAKSETSLSVDNDLDEAVAGE